MKKSLLIDGIILPPTHLELIVADHCNISCSNCNHASPLMSKWFADPNVIYRDFSIIAKSYRPRIIKVLGGEPLMHKNLDDVIVAARASGICDNFLLTTNGTMLDQASDAVWKAVDEVEISLYPGQSRATDNLKIAKAKAKAFNKKLTVNFYDQFRATFTTKGTSDNTLINKIYSTCKIANFWGCHAVRDGYFYKCPQSIYIPRITGILNDSDRLEITESGSFQEILLEFINSSSPLSSCTNCLGTVGILEDNEPMTKRQWYAHMEKSSEDLIDFDYLDQSMLIQAAHDDCKIPASITSGTLWSRHQWLRRPLSLLNRLTTAVPPRRKALYTE